MTGQLQALADTGTALINGPSRYISEIHFAIGAYGSEDGYYTVRLKVKYFIWCVCLTCDHFRLIVIESMIYQ